MGSKNNFWFKQNNKLFSKTRFLVQKFNTLFFQKYAQKMQVGFNYEVNVFAIFRSPALELQSKIRTAQLT